jgi:two-component system sensor histidine kinase ResE
MPMTDNKSTNWIDIVSEVAHDLKTPITSARGFIELMLDSGDPVTERQQRYAGVALEALDHMQQLVQRLLEIAWIEEDRPLVNKPCDLCVVIERSVDSLSEYATRQHVAVNVEINAEVGVILADERRLEQVLLNLVGNAIKYNQPDGQVWVQATGTEQGVEVLVRDSGRGIHPEDLPYIFERFYRGNIEQDAKNGVKIEGTGLGLAIVKELIEKHGGHIGVESVVGEGSTFVFTLPRARLSEGHQSKGEQISTVIAEAESTDTVYDTNDNEELDSVDDNMQEPPEAYVDVDKDESGLPA